MYVPAQETRAPDPKCCFCGLRPRTRSNDALRLVAVVLLLLPMILMLLR